jgi:hypothetical protein
MKVHKAVTKKTGYKRNVSGSVRPFQIGPAQTKPSKVLTKMDPTCMYFCYPLKIKFSSTTKAKCDKVVR